MFRFGSYEVVFAALNSTYDPDLPLQFLLLVVSELQH